MGKKVLVHFANTDILSLTHSIKGTAVSDLIFHHAFLNCAIVKHRYPELAYLPQIMHALFLCENSTRTMCCFLERKQHRLLEPDSPFHTFALKMIYIVRSSLFLLLAVYDFKCFSAFPF